jgi:quercetin dioxygenase-like cupin family protein
MRHPLRVVVVFSLLVTAVVLAQAPAAKPPGLDDAQVVSPKDAKWVAAKAPIPAGVMVSPIAADAAPGGSMGYAKYAPGASIPEHWHSAGEYTTVLAGNMKINLDGKTYEMGPGSYVAIPAKTKHQVTCLPGNECMVITRRSGPVDYNWVK